MSLADTRGPELTTEQRAIYERIETTREHLFITGRAGTGKSTILNHLAWHTHRGCRAECRRADDPLPAASSHRSHRRSQTRAAG